MVADATVLIGLDTLTLPLLQRLARTRRPASIVVIEPDGSHPLLEAVRVTGARIMIADPASERVLRPVLAAAGRNCALSYLYALRQDAAENEAILTAASRILKRYQPDAERQPHLVARIDDPRHADHWRGRHGGTSALWFEDALSPLESTASALIDQALAGRYQLLLLCGDNTLALAILLELARRAWERQGLARAAAAGRAAHPDAADLTRADQQALAALPIQRVLLVDQRAEDLRREYLATAPPSVAAAAPPVEAEASPWRQQLLAMLDGMRPAQARQCVVIVADTHTGDSMHEAGRVARLHPRIPLFVLTADGAGARHAIFDRLQPVQRTFLVDDDPPPDAWTRVARHWHECYRMSHPAVPGEPRTLTGRPWASLDDFIRQDNILQLRSVMTAVVGRGRVWVPARAVSPGSFIELTDRDVEEVARIEHTRWYLRRLAAGWTASPNGSRARAADADRTNSRVVPWAELPEADRGQSIRSVRSQLAQLEDVGFMPIVQAGGPPEAAEYLRVGTVRAWRLQARRRWTRQSGDELHGNPGDWRVVDDSGDERTVKDLEFRHSHEPLGGERWLRTGTVRAWQAREQLVLRTMEGQAIARRDDWVLEGRSGERWPVTDRQFRRSYTACPERQERTDQARRTGSPED